MREIDQQPLSQTNPLQLGREGRRGDGTPQRIADGTAFAHGGARALPITDEFYAEVPERLQLAPRITP